jgi:serine/threonine protein kinase
VTGGELFNRLQKEDALTESEVAFYLRQLILAVEHMHAKNVVHLDLKARS